MAQGNLQEGNAGRAGYRIALASGICILIAAYTVGVIFGYVPEERRIDGTTLGLIITAVLLAIFLYQPDILNRLKSLKAGPFEVSLEDLVRSVEDKVQNTEKTVMELQKFQHDEQNLKPRDLTVPKIPLPAPLPLPEAERKHLFYLDENKVSNYRGATALRRELRHLRDIGLIEMVDNHHVEELKSGSHFDLAQYVKLTELGKYSILPT